MKTLLSSLILVVALSMPCYLQAQEINGVYSATIAKTSGRGGLVARLSGAKQKVRLFLYESIHMLFARYEVYENATKDRTPSGQIYLTGSYSEKSGNIRLEDAGREIHDLNIGYPIREFAGHFDKTGEAIEPEDCYHCQGEKLTKEPDSDKEWRDFQRQIEEIKMKILYPRGTTTRQDRGVFFRLKDGKEWLSLGSTERVKFYVDQTADWCGDTLRGIAEANRGLNAAQIQQEAFSILSLRGGRVLQRYCPDVQLIQIYKYPGVGEITFQPNLHILNAKRSNATGNYLSFTVSPAEKEEVLSAEERRERALAEKQLTEAISALIALPVSYVQVRDLGSFVSDHADQWKAAGEVFKTREKEKIEETLSKSIGELMIEERAKIDSWRDDIPAIKAGNVWASEFQERFQSRFSDPEIHKTMSHFVSRRTRTLEKLEPEIDRLIARADKSGELEEIQAFYVSIPLPHPVGVVERIKQKIQERKEAVRAANRASGDEAFDWYFSLTEAPAGSRREFLQQAPAVAIIVTGNIDNDDRFVDYLQEQLPAHGLKFDPNSNVRLEVELLREGYVYSASERDKKILEKNIFNYTATLSVRTPGVVFREDNFYASDIIIASGLASGIFEESDKSVIDRKVFLLLDKALRNLMEDSGRGGEQPASPGLWQELTDMQDDLIPRKYLDYQLSEILMHVRRRGDAIQQDLARLYEERARLTGEPYRYADREKGFGGSYLSGLKYLEDITTGVREDRAGFTLSLVNHFSYLKNRWGAERRWETAFNNIGVKKIRSMQDRGLRPWFHQEIYGVSIELDGTPMDDAYGIISHAYLMEPNCIVSLGGRKMRVTARTLEQFGTQAAVKELLDSLIALTEESVEVFTASINEKRRQAIQKARIAPKMDYGNAVIRIDPEAEDFVIQGTKYGIEDVLNVYRRLNAGKRSSLHEPLVFKDNQNQAFVAGIEDGTLLFKIFPVSLNRIVSEEQRLRGQFKTMEAIEIMEHKYPAYEFVSLNYSPFFKGFFEYSARFVQHFAEMVK